MKRINVKLLALLVTGFVVFAIVTIGLYQFQMRRSTQMFLTQAIDYKESGDLEKAVESMRRYLKYRPDDTENIVKWALWTKQWFEELVANGERIEPREFQQTYMAIEMGLRQAPDNVELRDAAIQFTQMTGRVADAISHLRSRIELGGEDQAKHILSLALCHAQIGENEKCAALACKLIGLDLEKAAAGEPPFDPSAAMAPNEVRAYLLMAELLTTRLRKFELADLVIDQMVRANPNSPMALVNRAWYLRAHKGQDNINAAVADIDRAMTMPLEDEEEIDLILRKAADVYVAARQFDLARQQLDRYLERNPDDPEAHGMLAHWAISRGDRVGAREFLNQGLEEDPDNLRLLEDLAGIELDQGNVQAAESALTSLREAGLSPALMKFYEARLDFAKGNVVSASRTLEQSAAEIMQVKPQLAPQIDRILGFSYLQRESWDQALTRFLKLVDANENDLRSLWGVITCYRELGRESEALEAYVELNDRVLDEDGNLPPTYRFVGQHLDWEIERQKRRPKAQQDWKLANSIIELIRNSNADTVQKFTVLANAFEKMGDTARAQVARDYIAQKDPNNPALRMDAIRRLAETDVEAALRELDELERIKGDDMLGAKLLRFQLLSRQVPADFREQLAELELEADKFADEQRAALCEAIGTGYMAIQETNEVQRLFQKAIESSPQDVGLRMRMLKLAIYRGDEDAMQDAISNIGNIFGTDSAAYDWARASRLIWRFKNDLAESSALDEAAGLVQSGLTKREGWSELRQLSAEINVLQGDAVAALNEMEKAIAVGGANVEDIRKYARMLHSTKRFEDAKQQYDSLDRQFWTPDDQVVYLDIQSELGNLPLDAKINEDSGNAYYHLNVGNIFRKDAELRMQLASQPDAKTSAPQRLDIAAACFRRVVELEPTLEEGWRQLVRTLAFAGKIDEATEAIREAQLEITEERSQLFLAQVNEYIGNLNEAYTHYKSCLKTDPENVEALQGIVSLLQRNSGGAGGAARQKEATAYLDQILSLEPDPTARGRQAIQTWGRRIKAQNLVKTNTYHDFIEALSLLEQNSVVGAPMAPEDLVLFGLFCVSRNDGVSRDRAIAKMEQIQNEGQRRLTNQELLVLAELYKKQDRWQECSSIMNDLLAQFPNDMKLLSPWLAWLIEDDQVNLAERWLENARPKSLTAIRTQAHIWVKKGQTDRALETLLGLLPSKITDAEKEAVTVTLAGYMEQMAEDDPRIYPYVEKVWRNYVAQHPSQSLRLAAYLGRRGSPEQIDEAFRICQQQVDAGRLRQTLPVAVGILRVNQARVPIGSAHHDQVANWFDAAERASPDSAALTIQRSEFEGLVGRFDRVEENLRKYVASEGITPQQKATAYNNLAYVLALQAKGEEAMHYVDEALQILGPISDLRDTRAMVYLAMNKPLQALEDLDAAITYGGESPFKLFHKALAELENGDRENAAASMQRAIELGLEVNQLNVLEKQQFDLLVSELDIDQTKPVSKVLQQP